ncbi:MAG: cell envelope integrity protein TolA [Nitrospirota bacterium]|jgi:TolA protein
MIEPGLKRAAQVSFILHMAFLSIMFISIGRSPSFTMPQPYEVSLVSPPESHMKASRIPPAKSDVPVVEEKAAPEKVAPKKEVPPPKAKGVRTVEREPKKAAEDLTKYSDEKIAALRAKRESEEYKRDRMNAIRAKEKLARVKKLGEAKSSVEVTARPAAGVSAPEGAGNAIMGSYIATVRGLIEQEWVLIQPAKEGVYAVVTVRVMRNGVLEVSGMERSSGDALFDRAALRAVEKASPVPPPPFELELGVRFIPANG